MSTKSTACSHQTVGQLRGNRSNGPEMLQLTTLKLPKFGNRVMLTCANNSHTADFARFKANRQNLVEEGVGRHRRERIVIEVDVPQIGHRCQDNPRVR